MSYRNGTEGEMEHISPTNDQPDRLPGPVSNWVSGMQRSFIEPIGSDVADWQVSLAAETARLAYQSESADPLTGWSRMKRRGKTVFTAFFSTWIAKIMVGVVAVAGAVGGAAAAGVDMPDFVPFVGHDTPVVVEHTPNTDDTPGVVVGDETDDEGEDPIDIQAEIDELTAEFEADKADLLADYDEAVAGIATRRAALDAEKAEAVAGATTDYNEAVAGIATERDALDSEKEAEIADTIRWIEADLRELQQELKWATGSDKREIEREIAALLRERDAELAGIEQDFAEAYAGLDEELAEIEAEYQVELAGIDEDFAEAYAGLDEELAEIEAEYDDALAELAAEYEEALAELTALL